MTPKDSIGRSRTLTDPMDPWSAGALIATLDLDRPEPAPGDPLPPFWHWLYFKEAVARSRLGPDGHPAAGDFIPAVAHPRRMWAGGRVRFAAPLPLGRPAERVSTIADVVEKTGRVGAMTFVTLSHTVSGAAGRAVIEEQDLVYREDLGQGAPRPEPAPEGETLSRSWCCDSTVLFRYSALSFNGHKIHYDLDHARRVEGYPGLVVHGPLLATLMLELAREARPEADIARFSFRARTPVFADEPFIACARDAAGGLDLWIRGSDGRLAMQGDLQWAG